MQLKKTDKIAVWAPSSPAPYLFPRRFERSLNELKKRGYNVYVGDSCKKNISYQKEFAKDIVKEFHKFLLDDEIKAIIFAVGGWTTISLLEHIDWALVKEYPKPVIGYSDATALLLAINHLTGQETFHGPMIVPEWGEFNGPWDYSIYNFENLLFKNKTYLDLHAPKEWTQEILWWDKEDSRKRSITGDSDWISYKPGKCEGALVGGNLNVISLMLGTDFIPSFDNKILFIETEGFSPDKFLAYLLQLKLHRVFDQIKGLIIGRHSNPVASSSGSKSFNEILDYVFEEYNFPILLDVDLGHTEPMLTLPIGRKVLLNSSEKLIRILKEGAPNGH